MSSRLLQTRPVTLCCVAALIHAVICGGSTENGTATVRSTGSPGRILFYFPMVTKSMMMTFMPLVEAMAERGHEVVAVVPFKYKTKQERVDVIQIETIGEGNHYSYNNNYSILCRALWTIQ